MKVGSLYAGVGGICLGFKNAGYKLVWANEIDKWACETYRTNFKHKLYEEDVLKLDPKKLESIDVLTAGFPCQPFSVAGHRKGFDDKRGNHFFRIIEYIQVLKPKVIFLENVKNLQGHDKGNTFKVIMEAINKEGYSFSYKVINTKDYGNIPHNRERIFMVCFRNDLANMSNFDFQFPEKEKLNKTIIDIVDHKEDDETLFYRDNKYMYNELVETMDNENTVYQWRRKYVRENKSNVCPTLTANMGTGGHNVPLIITKKGIRKLSPIECFKFQGYPIDNGDYKLPLNIAKCHLYKQAGNSVSVPVIQILAEKIKHTLKSFKSNI